MPLPPVAPSLKVTHLPGRVFVRIADCPALDEQGSPTVLQQLSALPPVSDGQSLVLDLSDVRYATSTGLGALVSLNRRVRAAGGRFALANASPAVREALAITRLDTIIRHLPDGDALTVSSQSA